MLYDASKKHLVLLDGIPFAGGSKVATKNVVSQIQNVNTQIHVVTRDAGSWKNLGFSIHGYKELKSLERSEQGVPFYLKHIWIALTLIVVMLRCRGPVTLMGASGPGVDLAIYLVKSIIDIPVLQLVHGPVAKSRTICRCFCLADQVLYLPSTLPSIRASLGAVLNEEAIGKEIARGAYHVMSNGISKKQWPSKTASSFEVPHIFWAASLLRWKGINVLAGALSRFNQDITPPTTLCYINPNTTNHEISKLPLHIHRLTLHENPVALDSLRAQCNIFISTSDREPFGLSILEAMAAGLCIVIPRDGAYWDSVLEDGVNCIKYAPKDAVDLYSKLLYLQKNMGIARSLSEKSIQVAENYRAEDTYKPIIANIINVIHRGVITFPHEGKSSCNQHV